MKLMHGGCSIEQAWEISALCAKKDRKILEIATWWWRHRTQLWQFEHYRVEGAPTGNCPHEQAEVLHGRTDFNHNTRCQKELPKVSLPT